MSKKEALVLDSTVQDIFGAQLPGAHILNLDTNLGAVSDDSGAFSIGFNSLDNLIKISFVGYEELTLPVAQISEIVEMSPEVLDTIDLDLKPKKNIFWWILGGTALATVVLSKKKKKKPSAKTKV